MAEHFIGMDPSLDVFMPDSNELLSAFLAGEVTHLGTVYDNDSNGSRSPRVEPDDAGAHDAASAFPGHAATVMDVPDASPATVGDEVPSEPGNSKSADIDFADVLPPDASPLLQTPESPEQHLPGRSPSIPALTSGGSSSGPARASNARVPSPSQVPASTRELLMLLQQSNLTIAAPAHLLPASLRASISAASGASQAMEAPHVSSSVPTTFASPLDAYASFPGAAATTATTTTTTISGPSAVASDASLPGAGLGLPLDLQHELHLSLQQHHAEASCIGPVSPGGITVLDHTLGGEAPLVRSAEPEEVKATKNLDRLRRNRVSACKSRQRKKMYVSNLEQQVSTLQTDASVLRAENATLRQANSRLIDHVANMEAERKGMMDELARLRAAFTHSGPVSSLVANLHTMQKTAEVRGSSMPFKPSAPATMLIVLFAFALFFQPPGDSFGVGDVSPLFPVLPGPADLPVAASGARKLSSLGALVDADDDPAGLVSPHARTFFCAGDAAAAAAAPGDPLAVRDKLTVVLPASAVNATLAKLHPDASVHVHTQVLGVEHIDA